jgi:hypothetical protein
VDKGLFEASGSNVLALDRAPEAFKLAGDKRQSMKVPIAFDQVLA